MQPTHNAPAAAERGDDTPASRPSSLSRRADDQRVPLSHRSRDKFRRDTINAEVRCLRKAFSAKKSLDLSVAMEI